MKTTLKMVAAALLASVTLASAQDEAKKKDKPKGAKGGKGVMAADANKDGKITSDELKTWGAAKKPKPMSEKQIEKMMTRLDTNSDGTIDAEELKAGRKKKGEAGKPKGEGEKKKEKAPQ